MEWSLPPLNRLQSEPEWVFLTIQLISGGTSYEYYYSRD